jgi:hypothetical protein
LIELSLLGIAALGYAGSFFLTRHERAIINAAAVLPNSQFEKARKELKLALALPAFPWDRERWALCTNLLAFVERKLGNEESAQALIQEVLDSHNVAPPIRGLIYSRVAEAKEQADLPLEAIAYQRQVEEMYEAGRETLEKLSLWKSLAFYFYGTDANELAYHCFERVVQKEWTGPLLFLRWLCLSRTKAPTEQILKINRVAYTYAQSSLQRACLLLDSAEREATLGHHKAALADVRACLRENRAVPAKIPELTDPALALSIRLNRQLRCYDEANADRRKLFQGLSNKNVKHVHLKVAILHDEGYFEESARLMRDLPLAPELMYPRGIVCHELGDPEGCLKHLTDFFYSGQNDRFKPSAYELVVRSELACFRPREAKRRLDTLQRFDSDLALLYRSRIALLWDGDPDLADKLCPPGQANPYKYLYYGQFAELADELSAALGQQLRHAIESYRTGLEDFYQAVSFMWSEDWAKALKHYQNARPAFTGDRRHREYCRLFSLRCQAHLGSDVLAEIQQVCSDMENTFTNSKEVQADVRMALAHAHLALQRYARAQTIVEAALAAEPRAFHRARLLRIRALCSEAQACPASAKQDLTEIIRIAPRSFLAGWASKRLP